jgi:hypothetical protein
MDATVELSNGVTFTATVIFDASHQPGQILADMKRQLSTAAPNLGQSILPADFLVFGAPA